MTKKKVQTSAKAVKSNVPKKGPCSLDNRLLHITVATDLEETKDVDELYDQIEEDVEKKLKENGVENCIVFVSGPNIKLNLL